MIKDFSAILDIVTGIVDTIVDKYCENNDDNNKNKEGVRNFIWSATGAFVGSVAGAYLYEKYRKDGKPEIAKISS